MSFLYSKKFFVEKRKQNTGKILYDDYIYNDFSIYWLNSFMITLGIRLKFNHHSRDILLRILEH